MNICVTGASQGLGQELCKMLLSGGNTVFGVARNADALQALQAECPHRLMTAAVDVRLDASVAAWGSAMKQQRFVPDIALLNASIRLPDTEGEFNVSHAQEVIDTNLLGVLRCIDLFLPIFRSRGSGQIVLIASTSALRASAGSASYAASKAGAAMLMRSLRLRYGTDALRFRIVYLGPIATAMWEGKKSWCVPSPAKAARRIVRFLKTSSDTLYYPAMTTGLLRMSRMLPDRFFSFVSAKLLGMR